MLIYFVGLINGAVMTLFVMSICGLIVRKVKRDERKDKI